jgi:hypothetical protein
MDNGSKFSVGSIRRATALPLVAGLTLVLGGTAALAASAPNLAVSYTPPSLTAVYAPGTYGVRVANIGNRDAAGVQLRIKMPKTATSPQVYIMGNLLAGFSPTCALGGATGTAAGTELVCNLGTVRRSRSTSVSFTIALPEKTGALTFSSSATTTTAPETDPSNNINITRTAILDYYENAFSFDGNGEASYAISHCTGTNLTAYFECTKFPSSITSHPTIFHDDNTITIPGEPDYTGNWSIVGDTLAFDYIYIPSGAVEAEFTGRGVPGAGCWEGLTRFPDGMGGYSPYVSPYRVCL